jgi:uncharacterized protein YndB with AHSA1/START domain
MTDHALPEASSRISRVIKAPRETVYRACLDPDALVAWRAPDNMIGRMFAFDARVGGRYRMSLTYRNADHRLAGKTSEDTDAFECRFLDLVPNEKIAEVVSFESVDPRFAGEMTITTTLADAHGGTRITILFEGIPAGVSPGDNRAGTEQSLRKLAALLEH